MHTQVYHTPICEPDSLAKLTIIIVHWYIPFKDMSANIVQGIFCPSITTLKVYKILTYVHMPDSITEFYIILHA